jgi:hypothetical protein
LGGEWFPSLFLFPIFPLGTTILIITKPREKDKKEKETER